MNIEEIELEGENIYVYPEGFNLSMSILKETLYNWLSENEMLHWAYDPETPGSEPRLGKSSGDYTFDEYFNLDTDILKADIEKYIKTFDL